jgi:hypothetical protein
MLPRRTAMHFNMDFLGVEQSPHGVFEFCLSDAVVFGFPSVNCGRHRRRNATTPP